MRKYVIWDFLFQRNSDVSDSLWKETTVKDVRKEWPWCTRNDGENRKENPQST